MPIAIETILSRIRDGRRRRCVQHVAGSWRPRRATAPRLQAGTGEAASIRSECRDRRRTHCSTRRSSVASSSIHPTSARMHSVSASRSARRIGATSRLSTSPGRSSSARSRPTRATATSDPLRRPERPHDQGATAVCWCPCHPGHRCGPAVARASGWRMAHRSLRTCSCGSDQGAVPVARPRSSTAPSAGRIRSAELRRTGDGTRAGVGRGGGHGHRGSAVGGGVRLRPCGVRSPRSARPAARTCADRIADVGRRCSRGGAAVDSGVVRTRPDGWFVPASSRRPTRRETALSRCSPNHRCTVWYMINRLRRSD